MFLTQVYNCRTGGEFWGRASLLAMSHFIDTFTSLGLNRDFVRKMERLLKSDFRSKSYKIRQHRPPIFFKTQRCPNLSPEFSEFVHPIVNLIDPKFRVNGKEKFEWKSTRFDPLFGNVPPEPSLVRYFNSLI
jgi:hypothetical protein